MNKDVLHVMLLKHFVLPSESLNALNLKLVEQRPSRNPSDSSIVTNPDIRTQDYVFMHFNESLGVDPIGFAAWPTLRNDANGARILESRFLD